MRVLVTGSSGFVGTHLLGHLAAEGDEVIELAAGIDIVDAAAVRSAVIEAAPEVIYHLAGWAHVGTSWDDPSRVYAVNALGTANVCEAAVALGRGSVGPRVLVVGSADAYGAFDADELPLHESTPLRPLSPYGASKAAAEVFALRAHRASGLPVVLTRSFNHTGPGQDPSFVVPALATRLVAARAAGTTRVAVGNLDARRDVLDVADVVTAYRLLALAGQPGRAYNVCSGEAPSIAELAEALRTLAGGDIELFVDPDLVRAIDVPIIIGDNAALTSDTGWRRSIPLSDTLRRVLDSAAAA